MTDSLASRASSASRMLDDANDPDRSLDESHILLLHFRAGDSTAVTKLVGSVRPFLKHQVAELLGRNRTSSNDASDLVQQSLLQAIEQIDTFQGKTVAQWRSWLCAIVKNKVVDTHRYWASEKRDSQRVVGGTDAVQLISSTEQTPSAIAIGAEHTAKLAQALDRLTQSDRELVQLRQLDGLDHREIAQRLGITEAASRQRVKTAMSRLRTAWKSIDSD